MIKLFLHLVVGSAAAFAQGFDDRSSPQNAVTLRQQGQLFTVQLVLGEPLRFYVAGKEEAKLDLADLKVTVRRLKPYPGKILTLDLENGYFVPANPEDLKDATALEVTAQSKAKVDKVRFSIQKRQP